MRKLFATLGENIFVINIVLLILLIFIPSRAISVDGRVDESKLYFSISQIEKQKMVEKAKEIKVGETYESVLSKLGKPTHDDLVMRKKNNEIIGRALKYCAVKWEKGLVNEIHDRILSIYLDKDDRVKSVYIKVYAD